MSCSPSTVIPDPGCGCWPRARIGSVPKARAHGSRWDPAGLVEIDPTNLLVSRRTACRAPPRRFLGPAGARSRSRSRRWSVPTDGPARRQATGIDGRRFQLVAAVLERATGVPLGRSELFGASSGGVRVDDPACDLAIAAALASAATGVAPAPGAAFVGEVSLTGLGAIGARHGSPSRCCRGRRVLDRVRGGRSGAPV